MGVFVAVGIIAALYNAMYAAHSYKCKRPASGAGAVILAAGCVIMTALFYIILK